MRPLVLIPLALAVACQRPASRDATPGGGATYDVLLSGGWVVDGSGNPRWRGDVAIRGDRIAAMGRLTGLAARETLDVSGLARPTMPLSDDDHVNASDWIWFPDASSAWACAAFESPTTRVSCETTILS